MTQEFLVSVTPVGNDAYLVRTERVAPGVPLAEEQVRWPVDQWLAQARQLMNDPLLGVLQGEAVHLLESPHVGALAGNQAPLSLVELGQQFYSALFQGTMRDSWVTAQGVAQHRNEALRLRLGLKGNSLPRLPWEVLYGNDTPTEAPRGSLAPAPRPLATGTHIIFSRYHPNARLGSNLPIVELTQTLRVLIVIAAPTDRERLELEREVQQLQQELRSKSAIVPDAIAAALPDIQLTILKQPGREQLTQALEQGHYQVLHYAGHSDLGAAGGSLYLVNSRTGLTEPLSGDDLAGLLVNNGIRLAVFNSCRGAYTAAAGSDGQYERNLAEALISRGIPAVLAMAEQIPDNVALTLTWLFYRNLKLGYPIDLSLSRARQGLISAYGSHQLYWALPILYLHPQFDGYLTQTDRSVGNPADQLILIPQGYSALPILATEEVASPLSQLTALQLPPANTGVATRAKFGAVPDWAADPGLLDETYEEDVNLVADLLRQLNPPGVPIEEEIPADHLSVPMPAVSSRTDAVPRQSEQVLPIAATGSAQPPLKATRQPSRFSLLLGLLGILAIGGSGVWALAKFDKLPFTLPAIDLIATNTPDLQTADIEQVKLIAIDAFKQQRFEQGEAAVTALLDRNALTAAAEALAKVPTSVERPEIDFLWGRLAWQGRSTEPIYTLASAQDYWEAAVRAEPTNQHYLAALGFAYYEDNQLQQAMQAWAKVHHLVEQQSSPSPLTSDTGETNLSADALHTYAGMALAFWRASLDQPPSQRDRLLRRANDLYQKVQQYDSSQFQLEALRRNWLWSESTIRDWSAVSRIQI